MFLLLADAVGSIAHIHRRTLPRLYNLETTSLDAKKAQMVKLLEDIDKGTVTLDSHAFGKIVLLYSYLLAQYKRSIGAHEALEGSDVNDNEHDEEDGNEGSEEDGNEGSEGSSVAVAPQSIPEAVEAVGTNEECQEAVGQESHDDESSVSHDAVGTQQKRSKRKEDPVVRRSKRVRP